MFILKIINIKRMEKLCKNCKYYAKPDDEFQEERGRGLCFCDKFVYDEKDMYPLNDKLEYLDYEGYQASFYVGSNFGCIHFKRL